jgi:glycosyltransferase involved in cell wall biosynthesis
MLLAKCVQSVLAEQVRHVFVVDNDSHDKSLAYLENSTSETWIAC